MNDELTNEELINMKSIKSIKKQAVKAAELSFKSGKLDETVAKKFVKSFKALPLSEAVISLNYFLQALRRELGKTTLTIESVVKVPKSEIQSLETGFKRQFQILQTNEGLNPSLLGGIKVRIGDVIFDDSLKSRINQVKEALVN
ncbi:MAG TPA: F0F1 ATP synthase subunit delta [Patescibacteria group bacterium]|nr:F0F1 ATP synthase subunit delta [Patescibacteria group bacterium]